MQLDRNIEGDVTILRPYGRIDANVLPEFAAILKREIQGGTTKLLLNFSKTEYLSSAGIRALLEGYKGFEEKKGQFAICQVNDNLQELFTVVSLDKVLTIYPTEFEALDKMMV